MLKQKNQNGENQPLLTQQLRNATQAVHLRLHQHPLTHGLIRDELQLSDYKKTLQAFYGFYAAYECQSLAFTDYLPHWQARTDWLIEDFNYLKVPIKTIMRHNSPIKLDAPPTIWAYLYVTEGSSLGGQTIAKQLHKHLGLTAEQGTRFFSAYQQQTQSHWQAFSQRLNLEQFSPFEQTQISQAACAVFADLEQWLWHCHQHLPE